MFAGAWMAGTFPPAEKGGLMYISIGAAILILIAYFFVELASESEPVFSKYGVIDFVFSNEWVPSQGQFGALPLLVGTIITSIVALAIGVPVAVASALYVTELPVQAVSVTQAADARPMTPFASRFLRMFPSFGRRRGP